MMQQIESNSIIVILAIVILVVGIIIFLSYYFSMKQIVLRKLSKIPQHPISGIKSNELVKVTGKAIPIKSPLVAPLSGRKCVFYFFTIKKRVSSGNSSRWKTIVKDEKALDFFIENRGEYIKIEPNLSPKNYLSYVVKDKKVTSGKFKNTTSEMEILLKQYNINPANFLGFKKSLRFIEGVIEIGEQITVAGVAKWKTLDEPIPDYSYSKIATLESINNTKLIITNVPIEMKRKDRF